MQKIKSNLKNIFTSYWHFLALQKACYFEIFDLLETNSLDVEEVSQKLNLEIKPLSYLFGFLLDENYLKEKSGKYELTEKGLLFTERHPESIKNACILWGKEHLSAWQNLDFSLKTGRPSFENIFGAAYFDYLESSPKELKNYHLAMRDYAKDDYKDLSSIINFSKYKTIADVGGGLGVVVNLIASNYPNSDCILFDLPSVISLVEKTDSFQVRSGSFFEPLPFNAKSVSKWTLNPFRNGQ